MVPMRNKYGSKSQVLVLNFVVCVKRLIAYHIEVLICWWLCSLSFSLPLLRSGAGKFAEDKKLKTFSGILNIHVATDVFIVQRGVNL